MAHEATRVGEYVACMQWQVDKYPMLSVVPLVGGKGAQVNGPDSILVLRDFLLSHFPTTRYPVKSE